MKIGLMGLGRMGANMTLRLLKNGHHVVVWNRSPKPVKEMQKKGALSAATAQELVQKLPPVKIVWIMLPSQIVDQKIEELLPMLKKGDIIIDGGNSFFEQSQKRGERLKQKGIHFLDVGTSGGIWGLDKGYCLMIGGPKKAFDKVAPVFRALAPNKEGYLHVGPCGTGHFVKMVHNAIEYGMMQSIGEGFEMLQSAPFPNINLKKVAHLWNQGSVVRSWLVELAEQAFAQDAKLAKICDYIEDTGEGRWAIETALKQKLPTAALAYSLFVRYRSRQKESFSSKVVAALRYQFGGHEVKRK